MREFSQLPNNGHITATANEDNRTRDELWRYALRGSEETFIYGTTLLSRFRAEHLLYISFLIRRAIHKVVAVPNEPNVDETALPHFLSLIRGCRLYLEYGSGGTTLLAAALKKPFISVDTDQRFLQSLRQKIGTLAPDQRLIHANIGLTGPWGIPFPPGEPSSRRLKRWKGYAESPWRLISNDYPDFVLVDGRFRVATALTCCLHLSARSDVQIAVDDYYRPAYHVIEQHARLVRVVGRMAIFQPLLGDTNALTGIINQYSSDWR